MDQAFDRQHIWHPYTSLSNPLPVYPVTEAYGVRIVLEDGRELIDGMASWWSAIHGYRHPLLNEAAKAQLDKTAHVMFGGLTHEPAIELARLLVDMTPAPLQRVFLADSGSVAMEVALKMALQYWVAEGQPQRKRLLALRGGYHGDTFGAMSVCDPVNGMHEIFSGVLMPNRFLPRPSSRFGEACQDSDLQALRAMLESHADELAALVLEPIVQGAGGMYFYSADFLRQCRRLCDEFGLLLIADEIATGFGRSGPLFACEHADISPDIMAVGKALTGGYMSLAATLCTDQVAASISRDGGVFMHGPTFMANPLACSVAVASLNLLLASPWQARIRAIESQLSEALLPAAELSSVREARVLGAIGVLEMASPVDIAQAQQFFVSKGVWVRPFGHLVYIMPPYIIQAEELRIVTNAMLEFAHCVAAGECESGTFA